MNILKVVNNKIDSVESNDDISIIETDCKFVLTMRNQTDVYLEMLEKDIHINIEFQIRENSSPRIFVFSKNYSSKINLQIAISENANATINIFQADKFINWKTNIDLNGENSSIQYNYSCLGKTDKKLRVNHYASRTNSIVKNYAVSKEYDVSFEIIEYVPKNSVHCDLSQASKILNLGENKCLIRPILFIDEEEVNAVHSSIVTPISEMDLLYMMSRGIQKEESIHLLTNGFLMSHLSLNEKEKHILFEKYIYGR